MIKGLLKHRLFRPNRNWQGPKALVPVDICYPVLEILMWASLIVVGLITVLVYFLNPTEAPFSPSFWAVAALLLPLAVFTVCRGLPFTWRFTAVAVALLTVIIVTTLQVSVTPGVPLIVMMLVATLGLFFGFRVGLLGLGLLAGVFVAAAWGWTHGHLPLSSSATKPIGWLLDFRSPLVWIRELPVMVLLMMALLGFLHLVLKRLRDTLLKAGSSLQLLETEKVKVQQSRAELLVQAQLLRVSENRFRTLFETANDAILLMDDRNFLSCNRKAEALYGCRQEEIVGQSPVKFSPPRQPDGRDSAESAREKIAAAFAGTPQNFDWRHLRLDGTPFDAEVSLNRVELEGAMILIAIVRDVTVRRRAGETLRLSEAEYRHLFENALVGIYWSSPEGRLLRVNPALAAMYGYASPDAMIAEVTDAARQHYADPEERREFVRLLAEQGGMGPREYEMIRRDGTRIWVLETARAVRDAEGKLLHLEGTNIDITERKRVGEALRQSEERFRSLSNASLEGIMIHDRGLILDANLAFARLFGYEQPEELIGKNGPELLLTPESRTRIGERIRRQESGLVEVTGIRKNGSTFAAETESQTLRYKDRDARIVSCRDISDRKQVEARNREQAALLDNANDAIYVTALDSTILYWNRGAERTYGWTSAEAVNRKTLELLAVDPVVEEAKVAVLLKEGNWTGERWRMTKDGRKVEVFSRLMLVRDEQGKPRSIFSINTDITEKKQLEAQFLRAQRLESIGALASGIAHDLNNVLAPIIIGAPLLREMVKDQTGRHLLTTMETSAKRGADIVKQVLTFARGIEGERVPQQPRHLIREMERIAEETFPKSIRIESDVAGDLWPVLGDSTQLHQALLNLCVNARDAMPGGGVLTLSAANVVLAKEAAEKIPGAQPGSYVCLRVSDTGMGIPPEVEAKMFEPFFTTKGVGKGTGLGLSTVLGILRSHGGFIRVASEVGQGTTFELYLLATKAVEVELKRKSVPPWPYARGECILVVDDEGAVREVARRALMEFGYQVITASRGAEAVQSFRERQREIKLVLTDMMMPEMDGSALIAALRVIDSAVRIIGMTGMSDPAGMNAMKTLELSGMLAKPFTIDELLAVIREVLPVAADTGGTIPTGGRSQPAPPG